MSELNRHPLSAAWGDMPEEELQALVDDIEAHGQREPIVLLDGMVLDGWHRYTACSRLGLVCANTEFPADQDPISWVISRNACRRSLNAGQKALAIVSCQEWRPVGRPTSINVAPGATLPMKNEELAASGGVSARTIRQAKTVHDKGAEAVKEAVKEGKVSVKRAAEVAKLPKREQVKALHEKPAPKVEPADSGPSAAEIAETEAAAATDAETVRLLLESDDKLAALAEKCKQQAAQIRMLEGRVRGLTNEAGQAVRLAKQWRTKCERMERERAAA